jgi:ribosomal protein S18 acetylase RimI-like enzyme
LVSPKLNWLEDLVWETQGEIGDFYIAPPFRRRGHGKAFARLLFNWFAQKGVKYVRLYVRSDNPGALAFWHGRVEGRNK